MLVTSPPRPEIFFCQSLVLMALIGLAMAIIAENLPRRPWLAFAVPIALAAILVFEPFDYRHTEPQSQPLRKAYERLRPYESLINRPGVVTLYSRWELKHYIGHGDNVGVVYDNVMADWPSQESLAVTLDRRRIDLFFLDRNGMRLFDQSHPAPSGYSSTKQKSEAGRHFIANHTPAPAGCSFSEYARRIDSRWVVGETAGNGDGNTIFPEE